MFSRIPSGPKEYPPCVKVHYEPDGNIYHIFTFLREKQEFLIMNYCHDSSPTVQEQCITWKRPETTELLTDFLHRLLIQHKQFRQNHDRVFFSTNFGMTNMEISSKYIKLVILEMLHYLQQITVDKLFEK